MVYVIEKVESDEKWPVCPDCKIILHRETQFNVLSKRQIVKQKQMDECEHEYDPSSLNIVDNTCIKCGQVSCWGLASEAMQMRCPKCLSLYNVYDDNDKEFYA